MVTWERHGMSRGRIPREQLPFPAVSQAGSGPGGPGFGFKWSSDTLAGGLGTNLLLTDRARWNGLQA